MTMTSVTFTPISVNQTIQAKYATSDVKFYKLTIPTRQTLYLDVNVTFGFDITMTNMKNIQYSQVKFVCL